MCGVILALPFLVAATPPGSVTLVADARPGAHTPHLRGLRARRRTRHVASVVASPASFQLVALGRAEADRVRSEGVAGTDTIALAVAVADASQPVGVAGLVLLSSSPPDTFAVSESSTPGSPGAGGSPSGAGSPSSGASAAPTTTTTTRPPPPPTTTTTRPPPPPTTTTTTRPPPPPPPAHSESGQASWYSAPTGTCASPSLALGTVVTVTNVANGATTTCKVEDRGPYSGGRILDLSEGTFAQLAPPSEGVIEVRISW
jgi:hypothetical protein